MKTEFVLIYLWKQYAEERFSIEICKGYSWCFVIFDTVLTHWKYMGMQGSADALRIWCRFIR